jgi:5-methyltetrahydropteroyltriglutamate--homocysteine methyltransferase
MFRAEVIGSLLRPSYLKEARAAFERGELSPHDFKRVEDRAVDQVIALQEGAGVDVVTDGEMRRFLFMGPITEVVDGIEPVEHGNAMPWATAEGETEWVFPAAVTSKLTKRRSMVSEEYSYARARARLPLKVTVPSPLVLYGLWNPRYSTAAYSDAFEMFADAAEVARSEIQELVALGCEYIQVDAPELATLVDPRIRDWTESLGIPAERLLTEGIDLINGMVQGIAGVRLGIHLCRGNNAGMWMASGGYDSIAGALFRAGDRLRRLLPRVRRSALGLIRATLGRAHRQAGRARAPLHKGTRTRDGGRAGRPHRRGSTLLPARTARPLDAVRFRVDRYR